jgi:NAD(P)-dependent dehydrogenase (short-subunit alcohol dehydrogenase family)
MSPAPNPKANVSPADRILGKRAIVTGAANGIGRAITTRFLAEGADVACLDINAAGLEALVAELAPLGRKIVPVVTDVTRMDTVEAGVAAAFEALGGLDIVVNNVGLSGRGTVETTSEADWDRIALNIKSVFLVSRFAIPHLRAAGGGAIVNIGSCTGERAEVNRVAYGTAKSGVTAMTKLMALDHGVDNIRVNAVAPGITETSLSQGNRQREAARRGITFEELTAEFALEYPLGRTGDPGEIASAVLFLASDDARWITGVSLSVDGGWAAGSYRLVK